MKIKVLLLFLLLSLVPLNAQRTSFKPFAHYNDRMAEFAREEPINSETIVMLGDSMTEFGLDWNDRLDGAHIVNRGIMSDTVEGVLYRLDKVLAGHPKAIFLMIGINDLSHNLTAQQVADKINRLVKRITEEAPNTQLYVESCLPINESFGKWKTLWGRGDAIRDINRLVSDYCKRHDVEFINLYPRFLSHGTDQLRKELTRDGLHLSPAGYRIWGYELRPYIRELMEEDHD